MKEDRVMTWVGVLAAVMGLLAFSVGKWIMGGLILLLSFAIFFTRGGGKFNDRSIYEKVVKSDLDIRELYGKIRDIETPLGKPWIAEHKGFSGDSIVFGPNAFKDCIVISRSGSKLDIKHITKVDNIIRDESDEHRFKDFINDTDIEVTPKRYAIFVSLKLASVMLIRHLYELIERLSADRNTPVPSNLDFFKFYYHNSHEGWFKDEEGNDLLKVESRYSPFVARVLDADGIEMASVVPRAFNAKGVVTDSAGYDMYADGEHFGEITRKMIKGLDAFVAKTEAGEFTIKSFPACLRANVSCNYTIEKDGELKAVIGGSPNILFDTVGRCQNDVVLSYDDDLMVLYSMIEIFIMTLNKKFLK